MYKLFCSVSEMCLVNQLVTRKMQRRTITNIITYNDCSHVLLVSLFAVSVESDLIAVTAVRWNAGNSCGRVDYSRQGGPDQ